MKTFLLKLKNWAFLHKKTAIFLVIILMGVTYGVVKAFNNTTEETRYVLSTVVRGNIIASISGTGQVSASNQVDVTSKSSGDLIYLNAKSGQEVKTGALIAQIDSGDAAYELETAKLSYEELITVDDDELRDAEDAVEEAETNLKDAYVDARATLASASTDMADVMAGLDALLGGYLNDSGFGLSKTEKEYVERAEQAWYDADDLLDEFAKVYRTVSNKTEDGTIESMLSEANQISNSVAQSAKYAKDAVIYLRDHEDNVNTTADEAYTTVSELVTTINATVSETLSVRNTLADTKRTLNNAQDDLQELKDGPDTLDVRSEELSLKQKQDAYSDYFVRAPFDGIIASVEGKKGQNVNSGATIATLITKQKIAEISLNEVDAAKIEVGQKATLSFDAIEGLTITGEVIEVDLIGAVSQGVVSYIVKIGFDTGDDKVRSGMTVSANIITDMKQDVLTVLSSAVKTQGNVSYVEIVDEDIPPTQTGQTAGVLLLTLPTQVPVVLGLASDESVEIISGLTEGDQYVVRKITTATTSQSTSASAPSLLGGGGVRTGGGNFPR
ncbi:MAG: Efflux transporter, RND family, MFP subunit [Parcubacteria group bacterium GW2011_GWF2_38_8]|nr:MAG: Efflux transporter, RND family, MFP subunit [Parcubacteria group bacterium GW2011_GWF2_38_8]